MINDKMIRNEKRKAKSVKLQCKISESGFTLIEFLLYSIIVTFIVGALVLAGINVMQGGGSINVSEEVNHNGKMAMNRIMSYVRMAEGINSPEQGASASSLSLAMPDTVLYPTVVFEVSAGELTIKRGDDAAVVITAETVSVSNLNFINLSYPETSGTVKVEMTVEHLNPLRRSEYEFERNFYSTENVRR